MFHKERLNGHYGIAVYTLSNFLSSFPFLALMSVASATIVFYMVKFETEFSRYVFIALDLLSSIAVVESIMMIIASLVPNFLMGVVIGAGYVVRSIIITYYFSFFSHKHLKQNFLKLHANNSNFTFCSFLMNGSDIFKQGKINLT